MPYRARLVIALFTLIALPAFAASDAEKAQGFRNGFIIAKPKAGVDDSKITSVEKATGVGSAKVIFQANGTRLISLKATDSPSKAIIRLQASGLYEYVEPDYLRHPQVLPNDPKFAGGSQWALKNDGASGGTLNADIGAPAAWDVRTDSSSVLVAVMDTGVRTTHEDLAGSLWVNESEASNAKDDDGNQYIDDINGANFIVGKGSAESGKVTDDFGHGSAVASVIGATGNNGKGMSGVSWKAKIMSLKWDDEDGSAFSSNGVAAIDYAISKGAKIINVSYASPYFSQAEFDAYTKARDNGIIIVVAAGNDTNNIDERPEYPAAHLLDNVVTVAASTRAEQLADFSNYSSGLVDLAAPGKAIVVADYKSNTGYTEMDGTSFSAPMVTGALALIKAQYPADDYRATINRLLNSVTVNPAYSGKVQTGGRLNLAKALTSNDNTPRNDTFSTANTLEGSVVTIRASSKYAAAEAGAPSVQGVAGAPLLWWTWKAPASGKFVVDASNSTIDPVVGVFTGSALNALVTVPQANSSAARYEFNTVANTTYRIAIGGKASATGFIVAKLGTPPSNDNLSSAVTLNSLYVEGKGTTAFGSQESGEPTKAPTASGATVWYKWTSPTAVENAAFNVIGYGADAGVRAFTGTGVGSLAEVTYVTQYDGLVRFNAVANTTYYFMVDTLNGRSGTFSYLLTDFPLIDRLFTELKGTAAFHLNNRDLYLPLTSGYVMRYNFGGLDGTYEEVHGSQEFQSPALNSKGEVYFSDSVGYLSKFDREMKLIWEKRQPDTSYRASPALAADGTIYVHTEDKQVHAYRPEGTLRWSTALAGDTDDFTYGSVSIGTNGRLFVPSSSGLIYALAPEDGSILWTFQADAAVYASIAIGANNTLYFPDYEGQFYSLNNDGSLAWKKITGGWGSTSSPAIAANGDLIFGDYDSKVYALTSTGAVRWTYPTGDSIGWSSPAIASNGNIYIGSFDGYLYVLTSTGSLNRKYATGDRIYSSPLLTDGFLAFGSSDTRFFATNTGLNAAATPWPMHRGNARRTGATLSGTAPTIIHGPVTQTVATGGRLSLTVQVSGKDDMTFQWFKDGVAIAGATNSDYVVDTASAGTAGSYTVVITNGAGTVTSAAAAVTIATADSKGYLYNMSVLSTVQSASQNLAFGFYMNGGTPGATTPLLVRAVGPALQYIPNPVDPSLLVADPSMSLYNTSSNPGVLIETNDDWNGADANLVATQNRVGAFPYKTSTKDCALVKNFAANTLYSVEVSPKTSKAKLALIELYDASVVHTAASPRLVNASARNYVGNGNLLTVGFVLMGSTPVKMLIRAVGPQLTQYGYGVKEVLADPSLEIRRLSDSAVVATNDDWGAGSAASFTFGSVGAFPLDAAGKDAAVVVTLAPGNYTATVGSKGADAGVALLEIYEAP